ncbi:unnamed protein product [Ostreobium quekettii]|uniref:Uncharacterized protein n=1 Tax=Ostreobium quekettii TaxID=121088 RepID=A0A8S1IRM6_9CHLO|nr:unnamed protein product [Ostreobium quekettii]
MSILVPALRCGACGSGWPLFLAMMSGSQVHCQFLNCTCQKRAQHCFCTCKDGTDMHAFVSVPRLGGLEVQWPTEFCMPDCFLSISHQCAHGLDEQVRRN